MTLLSLPLLLLLLAVCGCGGGGFQAQPRDLEEGRRQYELLRTEAELPRYGRCWQRALQAAHDGCGALTDDTQSRLAVGFTNCFLRKSSLPTYECGEDASVSECTLTMTDRAFGVYAGFFTHTLQICQFLQSGAWHARTERTIGQLADSSLQVAQRLREAEGLQRELLGGQEDMLRSGETLRRSLQASASGVHRLMEEFRSSTDQQRQLIAEVFHRVASVQHLVMGEVGGVYTCALYLFAAVVCYLVTCTPRTRAARLWLLLIVCGGAAVERVVVNDALRRDGVAMNADDHLQATIDGRLRLCHKLTAALVLCVVCAFAYTYIDYDVANNRLLVDIQRQNAAIQSCLLAHGVCIESEYDCTYAPGSSSSSSSSDGEMSEAELSFIRSDLSRSRAEAERVREMLIELHELSAADADLQVTARRRSGADRDARDVTNRDVSLVKKVAAVGSRQRAARSGRRAAAPASPCSYNLRRRSTIDGSSSGKALYAR